MKSSQEPTLRSYIFAAVAAVSVALAPVSLGYAQEQETQQELTAEHVALGARLAEALGVNELYLSSLNAQRRDIIRVLASANPDVAPTITEVTDEAYLEMASTTGPLFESIARRYAEAFSQEDLTALIDFFEGDVGSRFRERQGEVEQLVLQDTISWGNEIGARFLSRVRELLAERGIEL